MEIKRIIISTYLDGVIELAPDLFANFGFDEELLEDFPRGFALGVRIKNENGSHSAELVDLERNRNQTASCPIVLLGDSYSNEELLGQLADETAGLIWHTSTCDIQRSKFRHMCFSKHVRNSVIYDAYAYYLGILDAGRNLNEDDLEEILDHFQRKI